MSLLQDSRPVTPPSTAPLDTGPTPRRDHQLSHNTNAGVDQVREMYQRSTEGHTLEITPPNFLDQHVKLPGLNAGQIDSLVTLVVDGLKDSGRLTLEGFPKVMPKKGDKENDTFRKLGPIVEEMYSICEGIQGTHPEYSDALKTRTTVFHPNPHRATKSETAGGSGIPDSHFVTRESMMPSANGTYRINTASTKYVYTCDAVGPAEYKLWSSDKAVADDQAKIRGGCGHILYSDPARRFVFAMTIEHRTMRLWFFSRAYIGVTEAFDFHSDPALFIRFLLFMTYGSLENLGFDPNFTRVRVNSEVVYHITVDGKTYQIIKVIDEGAALDIVTRATRVWMVQRISSTGKLVGEFLVMKDVWLYEGTPREMEILCKILGNLRALDAEIAAGKHHELAVALEAAHQNPAEHPLLPSSGTLRDDAKKYFMTIIADEVVLLSDKSRDVVRLPQNKKLFKYAIPGRPCAKPATVSSVRSELVGSAISSPSVAQPAPKAPSQSKARVHVRVIFKEFCDTIGSLKDYKEFASASAGVVKGLYYMRLAGYVHRDISPGNCLLHRLTMQIKISDLEYSREYARSSGHKAPLTGTPGFMAVEYQKEEHLFLPPLPDSAIDDAQIDAFSNPWFQFNFIHDLESVAWLYAWRLLTTIPKSLLSSYTNDNKLKAACKEIQVQLHLFFDGSLRGSDERTDVLRHAQRVALTKMMFTLKVVYDQVEKGSALVKALDVFRQLASIYRQIEASTAVNANHGSQGFVSTHWDPVEFTMHHYAQVLGTFNKVVAELKDGDYVGVNRPNWLLPTVKQAAKAAWNMEDHEDDQKVVKMAEEDDDDDIDEEEHELDEIEVNDEVDDEEADDEEEMEEEENTGEEERGKKRSLDLASEDEPPTKRSRTTPEPRRSARLKK